MLFLIFVFVVTQLRDVTQIVDGFTRFVFDFIQLRLRHAQPKQKMVHPTRERIGAIEHDHQGLQVIDRAAEVLPDKNALWLVYCRTGRRSADAVQKLEALGYTDLRDLGGILSWPYEIEGDFEGHF